MRNNNLLTTSIFSLFFSSFAFATVDPSAESLRIEKLLKPISNATWNSLASGQLGDTYEVMQGDTLSGLSNRLFGDPLYWPKLWSINNASVTNPHLIYPGQKIFFDPGAFDALPRLSVDQPLSPSQGVKVADRSTSKRSQEWKKLGRQSWESVTTKLPSSIDPQGLDRRSLKRPKLASKLPPYVEGVSKKEPVLGEIWRAASASSLLATYDRVYIDPEETLEVGSVYLVIESYERLSPKRSSRSGYFLRGLARVRIDAFKDNRYLATIISAQKPIERGDLIIKDRPDFEFPSLSPIDQSLNAIVTLDRELSSYATAAFRMVVLDRGTQDGVTPGMVCRTHLLNDPGTGKSIGDAPSLPVADLLVVKANEEFSTALIRSSSDIVFDGTACTFLTDISEFKKQGMRIKSFDTAPLQPLNLEEELTGDEKKTLEQLEDYPSENTDLDTLLDETLPQTAQPEPEEDQSEPEFYEDDQSLEDDTTLLEETPDSTIPEEAPLETPSEEDALDELLD